MNGLTNALRNFLGRHPLALELTLRLIGRAHADVAVFRRLLKPGDTVFDVGANLGLYTMIFAKLVGPYGRVHSFEPVPPIFEQLQRNVTSFQNVNLNRCALGDVEGTESIHVPRRDFSQAALIPHSVRSWRNLDSSQILIFRRCSVATLDRYVSARRIGDLALVKCDVEGAEMRVFRGATSLLRRTTPPMWFFESYSPWTDDFGYSPRDLFDFLQSEGGYVIFHIGRTGLRPVKPGDPIPGEFPDYLNFLAVIPSVHNDRIAWVSGG
jgi:FkbM family methyltransferase